MTTHEPFVRIEHGKYVIHWTNGEPEPNDLVLMSVELFIQSVDVLNGKGIMDVLEKEYPNGR